MSVGVLTLRALAAADAAELLRIHRSAEVVRWWGQPEADFPWDELGSTRLTIELDGRVAGLIQYWEEHSWHDRAPKHARWRDANYTTTRCARSSAG